MPTFSLDNLTVLGATPAEQIDIAERLGVDAISPIALPSPRVKLAITPLVRDSGTHRDLAARLRQGQVRLHHLDGFVIHPDTDWHLYRDTAKLAAELGASRIVTLNFDPVPERALDRFCQLCDLCAALGLGVGLEFMFLSRIPDLESARAFLASAAQPNAGIVLDFFHLLQSGGGADDVAAAADMICAAQLCDGFPGMSDAEYGLRAITDRAFLGEGALPIAELLAALPADAALGIEVPHRAMTEAGASPLERAAAALTAVRAFF